jgi:signal transduction histidine kinase
VLQNLIDNALRYSPENGTVRLISRATAEHVELRVIDEGPGIPEEARATVFEKWSRLARGVDQAVVGRGLGLAFCRLAVGAHGGTIEIEANTPRGAVFVVRLPLARAGS